MYAKKKLDTVRRSMDRHTALAGYFGGSNWHKSLGAALENAAAECSTPCISKAIKELQQLIADAPPLRSRATASAQLPASLNGNQVVNILREAFPPEARIFNLIEPIEAVYDKGSHTVELTVLMEYSQSSASMAAEAALEAAIHCAKGELIG